MFSQRTKQEEQEALDLHREAVLIDGLSCLTYPHPPDGESVDRIIESGVTALNWTVADCTIAEIPHDFRHTVHDITNWYSNLRNHKDKMKLATSVNDIREAKKEGKAAIIFGLQDPRPIGDDLALLEALHRLGVKIIQLTYMERNILGDGCCERSDVGLSRFGERVVEEMNHLGIVVDLSHCGRNTALDAARVSRDPVVFSHANASALCRSPRNKSDEELKAVAEKGGVIGAVPWGPMIWSKEGQQPTMNDYLNQIDYLVNIVGVDHVGFATDIIEGESDEEEWMKLGAKWPNLLPSWMTYEMSLPNELRSYVQIPNITKGLIGRGYSRQDARKILGENFLRVFEKTWK